MMARDERSIAGRFRVLSELGRGGMAVVHLVEDRMRPGPLLALKVVAPAIEGDDMNLRRFRREAETLAKLNHPHILPVLDFGPTEDGGLWLSMPRLEGEDLDRRLRSGPFSTDEALRIGRGVALALAHAHERGVVHRDLKPSNIFLDASSSPPTPRVLDFGISRVFNDPALTRITSTGRTLGSPGYMSPEQIRGEDLDGRSDLYALGVVLVQMLTGRLPLPGRGDMFEVLRAHLERPAPRMSELAPERTFEPRLEALLASMLAKNPKLRPPDANAVAAELEELMAASKESRTAARSTVTVARGPSAATMVLTAALGAGVVLGAVALLRGEAVVAEAPTEVHVLQPSIAGEPRVVPEGAPDVEPDVEPDPEPAAEKTAMGASSLTALAPAAPEASEERPRRARRPLATLPARPSDASPGPILAANPVSLPLPNDAKLRENIEKLRDGATPDERTAARASLLTLFRATIAQLPPGAQPSLSQELAGLAAAGSADGFSRFLGRVRTAWRAGGAR